MYKGFFCTFSKREKGNPIYIARVVWKDRKNEKLTKKVNLWNWSKREKHKPESKGNTILWVIQMTSYSFVPTFVIFKFR